MNEVRYIENKNRNESVSDESERGTNRGNRSSQRAFPNLREIGLLDADYGNETPAYVNFVELETLLNFSSLRILRTYGINLRPRIDDESPVACLAPISTLQVHQGTAPIEYTLRKLPQLTALELYEDPILLEYRAVTQKGIWHERGIALRKYGKSLTKLVLSGKYTKEEEGIGDLTPLTRLEFLGVSLQALLGRQYDLEEPAFRLKDVLPSTLKVLQVFNDANNSATWDDQCEKDDWQIARLLRQIHDEGVLSHLQRVELHTRKAEQSFYTIVSSESTWDPSDLAWTAAALLAITGWEERREGEAGCVVVLEKTCRGEL